MSIFNLFRQRKERLAELGEQRKRTRTARGRIHLKSRIDEVLDPRSATLLFEDISSADPLEFPGYADKVTELARRTRRPDAFICAKGTIDGCPVVCAELIPEFLMGSMGTAVGEAVCRSAEYALEQRIPLIIFSASGGARMQEGMFSLMQMAKTSTAIRRLSDAGILYISVLTHPTTGGVTASFASLGDIILAEPDALIGFAGPRVIEQTIGSTLPEGFQRSEFQRSHGFVDSLVNRVDLRSTLTQLLKLYATPPDTRVLRRPTGYGMEQSAVAKGVAQGASAKGAGQGATFISSAQNPAAQDTSVPSFTQDSSALVSAKAPAEHVAIARNPERPHAQFFISQLFEDFFELHGDRLFRDDRALIGGPATFEGMPVTVAAHIKGSNLNENLACNFGMPHPEGYRKFQRLAKQAEKFGRPLITFIDTPGAYPGMEAEERGQGEAIARCLFELSGLKVPIIAIVTGEGGSGGALALGVADRIVMFEYAIYSVISPEGFASILWKDGKRSAEASKVMKITAQDLHKFGMVDAVIKEPDGGAHKNPEACIESLRSALRDALAELCDLDSQALLAARLEKYRKFR